MALLQKGYLGSTQLWRNLEWLELFATKVVDRPGSITVTANTSAHTKGSWSQLIASTSANVSLIYLSVNSVNTSATNTATLLDIATGASGSETAIASNIAVGGASFSIVIPLPVKIASGTRVSARIQSVVTGGKTAALVPIFLDGGDYATSPTTVDVIGADTANSKGISFSGASGTWVEATASTSQAYRAVVLVPSMHDADIATIANTVMEVGVGASGSEVSFGSTYNSFVNTEQVTTAGINFGLFGRRIPSGSRLAVKHNISTNPGRYGFTLIGIP
jgi:hypothetical protein